MNYPTILGVNIDHVATIRQARGTAYPDLLEAVKAIEETTTDAITIHLREDRRHIQDVDVPAIMDYTRLRVNLELAATDEMVGIACNAKPHDCCIVPEKREELTTEGGLDVIGQFERIKKATAELNAADVRVSLFIEPDLKHIDQANAIGAPVIELHTGAYAEHAENSPEQKREFERIVKAAEYADSIGLHVNAGHGLHYTNTRQIADIPAIRELNIGHAIVARALFVGLKQATEEMIILIK
ncbi:MAG: pyridoxine 5'-phosphate synthase [Arenicellales bacterium]